MSLVTRTPEQISHEIKIKKQKLRRLINKSYDPLTYDTRLADQHHQDYLNHKEERIAKVRLWQKDNPEKHRINRNNSYKRNSDRINKVRREKYARGKILASPL